LCLTDNDSILKLEIKELKTKEARMAKAKRENQKSKKHIIKNIVFVCLILFLAAFGGFYFVKYLQINNKYKNLTMTQEEKNQNTVDLVAKLIDLPKNEKPTIFEVKDKSKLGSAPVAKNYFASVKNGDVILAYQKANLSIIYRPSEKKIVKTDSYTNFYAAANPVKVAIIAPQSQQQDTENLIKSKVINVEIISKHLPKNVGGQSMVVDATGQNAKAAKELAEKIGLSVGQLPEGETKPKNASLIVIITAPGDNTPNP